MQWRDPIQRRRQLRLEALHRLAEGVIAPYEDPCIPQVIAALDQRPGGLGVRLLDESLDLRRRQVRMQPGSDLDVSVARRRMGGLDAKRHQVAALGGSHRLSQAGPEGFLVRDEVVRG